MAGQGAKVQARMLGCMPALHDTYHLVGLIFFLYCDLQGARNRVSLEMEPLHYWTCPACISYVVFGVKHPDKFPLAYFTRRRVGLFAATPLRLWQDLFALCLH